MSAKRWAREWWVTIRYASRLTRAGRELRRNMRDGLDAYVEVTRPGAPWYGSTQGKEAFGVLVEAAPTCYICDPDNPNASPEGCDACDRDWQEAIMAANRNRHPKSRGEWRP